MTIPSHLTDTEAMNLLQDAGIISDNCVGVADIATADLSKAIEFLKGTKQ